MEQSTIQIDAFNTNLNGCHILCQGPFPNGRYAPITDSIQKLREPFKRKVLVTRNAFSFSKYLALQYDAVYQVKDLQDWSLILTYFAYAPKPLLVVVEDVQIPEAVWAKLNRSITFVHITSTPITNFKYYDAIFFAPVEDTSTRYADFVYKQLQVLYKASYSIKEHKEVLQELRVAGAGIAWTRHQEQTQNGSIYWYDPVSSNIGDTLSKKQLSELFGWLSEQFSKD
jgi:hypothetical protein